MIVGQRGVGDTYLVSWYRQRSKAPGDRLNLDAIYAYRKGHPISSSLLESFVFTRPVAPQKRTKINKRACIEVGPLSIDTHISLVINYKTKCTSE